MWGLIDIKNLGPLDLLNRNLHFAPQVIYVHTQIQGARDTLTRDSCSLFLQRLGELDLVLGCSRKNFKEIFARSSYMFKT